MIVEIDSQTFPFITFTIRGKGRKVKVSQTPLEESRKRPDVQANFLLFTKRFLIQEMLDGIVYSSFDVRVIR